MRLNNINCRNLEDFSDNISQILQNNRDIDHNEVCDLLLPRLLLHNLGKYPQLSPPLEKKLRIPEKSSLINLPKNEVLSLTNRINSITVYGQRNPTENKDLLFSLQVWMIHAFRSYDLELGASLLRTLKYCNLTATDSYIQGLNFLIAQNNPEGHFGYFAEESIKIQSKNPKFDCILDLYLPVTLTCLWTIAESNPKNSIISRNKT